MQNDKERPYTFYGIKNISHSHSKCILFDENEYSYITRDIFKTKIPENEKMKVQNLSPIKFLRERSIT